MYVLGEKLKLLRQKHDLTQEEMSRIAGVSQRGYGYYEQGLRFPRGNVLANIADHFDVAIDWLMGQEQEYPLDLSLSVAEMTATADRYVAEKAPLFVREFCESDEGQDMIALICAAGLSLADLKQAIALLEQKK